MPDPRLDELAQALAAIRERVAVRYPAGELVSTQIPLVDLTPVLQARDAAEAKVASIGSVNPRPSGPLNILIQAAKSGVARCLGWFVRDQIDFNRAAIQCVQTTLDALNEFNRLAVDLNSRIDEVRMSSQELSGRLDAVGEKAQALADVHVHWIEWRREWEHKLATNEIQFLRAVGDLEAAYQQRALQQEANFREIVRSQHRDFEGALDRYGVDIQKRLWSDLEKIRLEYERLIHTEIRTLRQRLQPPVTEQLPAPPVDQLHFGFRFRGTEQYVKEVFAPYLQAFAGRRNVLDIGCGRGEFLELAREKGIGACGIDSSPDSVAVCLQKGLAVEQADLFDHLGQVEDFSFDGLFCAQVVEHLPPSKLPEFIHLVAQKLAPNAPAVFETPNPECLAIFTTHFFLDPTHTRPVPAQLLGFYLEEAGFGRIRVEYRQAADPNQPLSPANAFDYSVVAVKL